MRKIFLLLFFWLTPLLFAENSADSTYRFLLPVNWTTATKYNLQVTIPAGFVPLQAMEKWSDPQTLVIEFVRKGKNWSEIISIQKFIGKKISAKLFTKVFKEKLLSKAERGRVLRERSAEKASYIEESFILAYDLNNQHEVLGALYYSGPEDCVGVQYTIHSKSNLKEKEAVKIIEKFFNTSTLIIAN